MKYRLILAFGSNVGDKENNFRRALKILQSSPKNFQLLCQSHWHTTQPFQKTLLDSLPQENYLNFVCEIVSDKPPQKFYLENIVPLENTLGHCRTIKWAPRVLDIDILFAAFHKDKACFQECVPILIDNEEFSLPHKEFLNRDALKKMLKKELNLGYKELKCHFIKQKI